MIPLSHTMAVKEEFMFVALGKNVKEAQTILMWALHNSRGRKICILHVHQPAHVMPMMGTKVSISRLEELRVKAYHENEREEMHKILDSYIHACEQAAARAVKIWIEMESVEEGIVHLMTAHGIKWLVMGAAANNSYSRKMKGLKSRKAIYVNREAPDSCHIWFTCKGNLINTRRSKPVAVEMVADPSPLQASPIPEILQSLRSRSVPGVRNEWDMLSSRSPSVGSHFSSCSSDGMSKPTPQRIEGSDIEFESSNSQQSNGDHYYSSLASNAMVSISFDGHKQELNTNDEIFERLEQFVAEAETSRRDQYDESVKRKKVEKEVIDAIRRAKASETMYKEELKRRKQIEEAVARSNEEVNKTKRQLHELNEELRVTTEHKYATERQIIESDKIVKELEQKMISVVELLQKYKKERDELEIECAKAVREAEEMREKQSEEASHSFVSQFLLEFSILEIEEGTGNFSQALKIGEGGYGSIYKGYLRCTEVAIKMLSPNSLQGPKEFLQEVNTLSKVRHPNVITLIGACPQASALIYEYLPIGSLEDRLNCKDNTTPLSWKTRISIASELCSALVFLHSCYPQGIVHGDLKPSNILLDANFVTKLSDFGICRLLSQDSENNTTRFCITTPKGTIPYIDPIFLATGELTSKSDVYSFGIILLRLLTGRPAMRIAQDVRCALETGNLNDLLDPMAGDWPFVQARQLAHLAINCSDLDRKNRPDLASGVWRVLESMKVSCGLFSSFQFGSNVSLPTPAYFVCPIFQEIMRNPVVAADGFTYEAEALIGWLDSGHYTSPMTNNKLPHSNMVPNYALRSAIQEWLPAPT